MTLLWQSCQIPVSSAFVLGDESAMAWRFTRCTFLAASVHRWADGVWYEHPPCVLAKEHLNSEMYVGSSSN
jgi:hypothetical protein